MKKLLILMLLLLSVNVSAFIRPIDYNGVKIKFYYDIDREPCLDTIKSVPPEYFDGLSYIKFHKTNKLVLGYYWINTGIDIFEDCSIDTLVHELAHHCQIQRKDYFYQALNHNGKFLPCLFQRVLDIVLFLIQACL